MEVIIDKIGAYSMSGQYPPEQPYNNDNPQGPQYPQQQAGNDNPQYPQQPGQPSQGYPQQPPIYQQPMMQAPKKRTKWPWIAGGCGCLTVLAIIAIVIITSTTATVSHVTSNTPNSSATTQSIPTSSSNTNTIAKVGQTITVDDFSCTVASVKTLTADEFNKPKSGYQFIVVHITMKNASSIQVSYNLFDFHIKSATGNVTDAGFSTPDSYTANNTLDSGNLDPNGSVNGDLIMQAPLHDAKAELTWAPFIFSNSTQYGWTLGSYA